MVNKDYQPARRDITLSCVGGGTSHVGWRVKVISVLCEPTMESENDAIRCNRIDIAPTLPSSSLG